MADWNTDEEIQQNKSVPGRPCSTSPLRRRFKTKSEERGGVQFLMADMLHAG